MRKAKIKRIESYDLVGDPPFSDAKLNMIEDETCILVAKMDMEHIGIKKWKQYEVKLRGDFVLYNGTYIVSSNFMTIEESRKIKLKILNRYENK